MNIYEIYEFLSGYFFPMLPFLIPARYLRKLERFLARVIGKAVAKWLKKFVKAFLTAVMVMTLRGWEGHKHRAVRKVFCCFCCVFRSHQRITYETPHRGYSHPLHSDRVSSSQNMAARHPSKGKKFFG